MRQDLSSVLVLCEEIQQIAYFFWSIGADMYAPILIFTAETLWNSYTNMAMVFADVDHQFSRCRWSEFELSIVRELSHGAGHALSITSGHIKIRYYRYSLDKSQASTFDSAQSSRPTRIRTATKIIAITLHSTRLLKTRLRSIPKACVQNQNDHPKRHKAKHFPSSHAYIPNRWRPRIL